MADVNLTQSDADALLALPKARTDEREYAYPYTGGKTTIPLISQDGREQFILDLYRGGINLSKNTLQNRARRVVVLARLDIGGAPHRNPDDKEVPAPHLHIYREGYGDKWAIPVPVDRFGGLGDTWQTLQDFMRYCNIVAPPIIRRQLPLRLLQ